MKLGFFFNIFWYGNIILAILFIYFMSERFGEYNFPETKEEKLPETNWKALKEFINCTPKIFDNSLLEKPRVHPFDPESAHYEKYQEIFIEVKRVLFDLEKSKALFRDPPEDLKRAFELSDLRWEDVYRDIVAINKALNPLKTKYDDLANTTSEQMFLEKEIAGSDSYTFFSFIKDRLANDKKQLYLPIMLGFDTSNEWSKQGIKDEVESIVRQYENDSNSIIDELQLIEHYLKYETDDFRARSQKNERLSESEIVKYGYIEKDRRALRTRIEELKHRAVRGVIEKYKGHTIQGFEKSYGFGDQLGSPLKDFTRNESGVIKELLANQPLVEIGCGDSFQSTITDAKQLGVSSYVGLDINRAILNADKNIDSELKEEMALDFLNIDALSFFKDLPDRSVSVVSANVFDGIIMKDKKYLNELLREMARVSKVMIHQQDPQVEDDPFISHHFFQANSIESTLFANKFDFKLTNLYKSRDVWF